MQERLFCKTSFRVLPGFSYVLTLNFAYSDEAIPQDLDIEHLKSNCLRFHSQLKFCESMNKIVGSGVELKYHMNILWQFPSRAPSSYLTQNLIASATFTFYN